MSDRHTRLSLGEPAHYQIQIQGRLDGGWADHFSGMTLAVEAERGITLLEGIVPDQAALFGLLLRIRDLGLPLLLVRWLGRRESSLDYPFERSLEKGKALS